MKYLLGLLFLIGCQKYEAGTCFELDSNEFNKNKAVTKIIKRGKYNYTYKYFFTFGKYKSISEGVFSIKDVYGNPVEKSTHAVECPEELK